MLGYLQPVLAILPRVIVTLMVHLPGAVVRMAVGIAGEVAHAIGAADHLGPLLLQQLAWGDVWQRPATAEHGTDSPAEGEPQFTCIPSMGNYISPCSSPPNITGSCIA